MSIEGEAAGDVITGGIIAHTIEGAAAGKGGQGDAAHGNCRNCGATLTGAYCAACGQAAHIHRSLVSLGHDILHGVFHFEGKIWRTIPELFFHPGRLTRRYIDGERVKFVSPMALYLFTVFLMFAVFAFTGGPIPHNGSAAESSDVILKTGKPTDWKTGLKAGMEQTDQEIAALKAQLADPNLSEAKREALQEDLTALQTTRAGMAAMATGDLDKFATIGRTNGQASSGEANAGQPDTSQVNLSTGWPALDRKLAEALKDVEGNPRLLLYKLKTNGYKFSWALIPLSIPFLWLLFFWRRDVHVYDHAIFVTYSITFIMQLLVLVSLVAAAHVSVAIWGCAIFLVPLHMYKQLRGAYGLSRFGALVRLMFLMFSSIIVLSLFSVILVALGVLG
ncbi:MAG TPA: DUF3667 domain-containing protein [Povalibacter sp.]|nr:DUF3667 domain-containing protein [Povalibacter sp.]